MGVTAVTKRRFYLAPVSALPLGIRHGLRDIGRPSCVGLVASLNRPGGNLTGVATLGLELGQTQLKLLHAPQQIAPYSITSSAVASSDDGIVRPSALAVLRLRTIAYLVAAWTGRSAGFSPLRMR